MNRERLVPRIVQTETGQNIRVPVGTDRGAALAVTLSEHFSEEFLEVLVRHLLTLDEHGGRIFLGAVRAKFDRAGYVTEHNDPEGSYETYAHCFNYSDNSQLKGRIPEPEIVYGQTEPPQPEPAGENGTEPEPVAVGAEEQPEE